MKGAKMKKIHMQSLAEIQSRLQNNEKLYWSNALYEVHFVPNVDTHNQYTRTNNNLIRVSCVTNYFGSLLDASEVLSCFKFEGEK